jgi:MFS family permease
MIANYYGGRLSDRVGPRAMILAGWLFYAAIYLTFGWLNSAPWLIAVFLAYGIYFGLVEPAERAWVASLVPAQLRGTAFGWYHCAIGLAALPASVAFGLLWQQWAAAVAFSAGAVLAALAAVLLPAGQENATGALNAKGAGA